MVNLGTALEQAQDAIRAAEHLIDSLEKQREVRLSLAHEGDLARQRGQTEDYAPLIRHHQTMVNTRDDAVHLLITASRLLSNGDIR